MQDKEWADGQGRQIKSRERVVAHGEVFTAPREVNAMLDLVKDETERIDSRFLEPACGDGNFLVKILQRKLDVVKRLYGKSVKDYQLNALTAVGSIYGIDILEDNVEACRKRLIGIFTDYYCQCFRDIPENYSKVIHYIIARNILWGDALTLCTPDNEQKPIIFSEWTLLSNKVKRRDFTMEMLIHSKPLKGPNLFSDMGVEVNIPVPVAEFPLTYYLNIASHD